jgi:hypothetical protein
LTSYTWLLARTFSINSYNLNNYYHSNYHNRHQWQYHHQDYQTITIAITTLIVNTIVSLPHSKMGNRFPNILKQRKDRINVDPHLGKHT